ncbi:MAG: hypothetical protein AB7N80_06465 [Bdellovibrionales bacterium]
MLLRTFAFAVLVILCGCVSPGGLTVGEVDRPLSELQHIAAKSLPLGLRTTSANGREFFSNYFVAAGRKFKAAEKLRERKYAQIQVLGDRRPYKIQVYVQNERTDAASQTGYSNVGTDLGLAKVIKRRVQQQLNKRREDLNIIDDFRVF